MAEEIDEAYVEAAVAHYRRLDERRTRLLARAADTAVTIRSGDGLVEIVVTADGGFRDVRIAEAAMRTTSARELSRTVLAACQQASHGAAWAREKLAETLLDGDPFGG